MWCNAFRDNSVEINSASMFCWILRPERPVNFDRPDRDRRQNKRYKVSWPAMCTLQNNTKINVLIIDVSEGGVGIDCSLPIEIDDPVIVDLRDIGVFGCTLRWKTDWRSGLQFQTTENILNDKQLSDLSGVIMRVGD